MSVLIKGMKMPTSCARCPMLDGDRLDGLCHAASRWLDDDEYWTWYVYPEGDMDDSKPCNCPLIELPSPHGKLIDVSSLDPYNDMWKRKCIPMEMVYNARAVAYEAPAILEAEVEDG